MDTIEVELPDDAADELLPELEGAGIEHSASVPRRMTGETMLVSVILPVTLTAVQVLVAFILARRDRAASSTETSKAASRKEDLLIKVNREIVQSGDFSVTRVEEIIRRKLAK